MKSLPTAVVILLSIGISAILLAVALRLRKSHSPGNPWPFYIKRPLTQPEQVLYFRLVRALPEHIILAQVQVSRVLGVKRGSNFHEWNNRINRLSYDFVVCGKDASVIAAVELDDKSHIAANRAQADEKKSRATADAGLRLIRWHVRALPSESAIRTEVLTEIAIDS